MKIAAIQCLAADAGWRVYDFLKLTLDDGRVGWSEFSRAFNGSGVVGAIEGISEQLVGRDPRSTGVGQYLREVGRQSTLGYQAGAAIGNAVLDVRARALGVPVWQLLGPRVRDHIEVYWAHCGTYRVSHADLMAKPPVRQLSDLVMLGREVADGSFSALKTNLLVLDGGRTERYAPRRAEYAAPLTATPRVKHALADQLEALRSGAGAETDIMIDLGSNFRVAGAIAIARHVERFDLSWIELELSSLEALKEVRSRMPVPLASGERLRAAEYHALLRERAVDLPIVDLLFNGVADSLHVAAACEAYETNIAVHNCYSPLATFMAAAFCAVAPNAQILEMDVDNVTWENDFVTEAPRVDGGRLSLPVQPGWGVDVNETAVRAHPVHADGGRR
jgi:L-alanine-DL-glutamate epimerase-like enolase superfamily enzyme